MKKKGKKGGKKCWRLIAGLAMAVLILAPLSAHAQFAWSEKPIYITFDHVGISTTLNADGGAGVGARAVIGPVAQASLGANKFELGLFSVGAGVFNPAGELQDASGGGQLGFVPSCTDNRSICLEITAQKFDATNGTEDDDIVWLGTVLFRPLAAVMTNNPVPPVTLGAVKLQTFTGLNSFTP